MPNWSFFNSLRKANSPYFICFYQNESIAKQSCQIPLVNSLPYVCIRQVITNIASAVPSDVIYTRAVKHLIYDFSISKECNTDIYNVYNCRLFKYNYIAHIMDSPYP